MSFAVAFLIPRSTHLALHLTMHTCITPRHAWMRVSRSRDDMNHVMHASGSGWLQRTSKTTALCQAPPRSVAALPAWSCCFANQSRTQAPTGPAGTPQLFPSGCRRAPTSASPSCIRIHRNPSSDRPPPPTTLSSIDIVSYDFLFCSQQYQIAHQSLPNI